MRKAGFLVMATGFLLAGPVPAQEKKAKSVALKTGDVIRLSYSTDGDGSRWLSGESDEGTVTLLKDKDKSAGTKWKVIVRREAAYLVSLADVKRPRYLHGHTVAGTVNLVAEDLITQGKASGAKWEVVPVEGNTVRLKCLGDVDGVRWLSASTAKGGCKLVKRSDGSEVTAWDVEVVKASR